MRLPLGQHSANLAGMSVSCPACQTRYNLSAAQIGAGRTLKCARCGNQWFQQSLDVVGPEDQAPPQPLPEQASPEAPAVQAGNAPAPEDLALTVQTPRLLRQIQLLRERINVSNRILTASAAGVAILIGAVFYVITPDDIQPMHTPEEALQTQAEPIADPQPDNLILTDLNRTLSQEGGLTLLRFNGKVTNTGTTSTTLPELRVELLDKQGKQLDYWPAEPAKNLLNPGETTGWQVRFINPQLGRLGSYRVYFRGIQAPAEPAKDPSPTTEEHQPDGEKTSGHEQPHQAASPAH